MTDETPKPAPPDPRHLVAVLVRQQGRVRVTARELAEIANGKIALKPIDGGGWVLEFVEG